MSLFKFTCCCDTTSPPLSDKGDRLAWTRPYSLHAIGLAYGLVNLSRAQAQRVNRETESSTGTNQETAPVLHAWAKNSLLSGISDGRARTTLCYLDLSATIAEGDDSVDVGAVGLEAAAGVGRFKELQMTNKESRVRSSLNGHRHRGLGAGHAGFNWSWQWIINC